MKESTEISQDFLSLRDDSIAPVLRKDDMISLPIKRFPWLSSPFTSQTRLRRSTQLLQIASTSMPLNRVLHSVRLNDDAL